MSAEKYKPNGRGRITFDKFASPQEAMTAFEAAVEAENVRRDHEQEREMLEYLGIKTAPPGAIGLERDLDMLLS
jgi:hypothetical protein